MIWPVDEKDELSFFLRYNVNDSIYVNKRSISNSTLESEEELKSLLMRVKEETEKAGLKFSLKKN